MQINRLESLKEKNEEFYSLLVHGYRSALIFTDPLSLRYILLIYTSKRIEDAAPTRTSPLLQTRQQSVRVRVCVRVCELRYIITRLQRNEYSFFIVRIKVCTRV